VGGRVTIEAGEVTRRELVAALAFVNGSLRWNASDLIGWFEKYVVAQGVMARPSTVREAASLPIPLSPGPSAVGLSLVLASARARIVHTMSGLVVVPSVDAFLNAAIFSGRVRRVSAGGQSGWRATPEPHHTLSDIVLSMLVADILAHREVYDANLAVCATCGKISFDAARYGRARCGEHAFGSKERPISETMPRVVEPAAADDEIDALHEAWSGELLQALRTDTGWSSVGSVDVVAPSSLDTFDRYTDEQRIRLCAARCATEVVTSWRGTTEGRFIERAVLHVNDELLDRVPASEHLEWLDASWYEEFDETRPIALLGSSEDLRHVLLANRGSAVAARLRPCPAHVQPGVAVAVSGADVACTIVAALSFYSSPADVSITTLVDVRATPGGTLRRVDLSVR
jgi:hypothetical protein